MLGWDNADQIRQIDEELRNLQGEIERLQERTQPIEIKISKLNGLLGDTKELGHFTDFKTIDVANIQLEIEELTKDCQWLQQKVLYYWGDLDTHGLAILSRFRNFFPNTQAVMMDDATFDAHPNAWVAGKPYYGSVPENLSTEERQLFERLNSKLLRLEQERVQYWMLP